MSQAPFIIDAPRFNAAIGEARFGYRLGEHAFTEILRFDPDGIDTDRAGSPAFAMLLDLTAAVLGVSYFKLRAPLEIDATTLALPPGGEAFLLDIYENGLGEFYARNGLKRFGRLTIKTGPATSAPAAIELPDLPLVPIGGGKDSLVTLELLDAAGLDLTLFAVNAKGPILSSAERSGRPMITVQRILDPEMIRLGKEPGYYNGHVPSTAIISMIAALASLLFGYSSIILSNERSASEGNIEFDGRQANHQYSKSLDFERVIRNMLREATGGALDYFSLLRPYSEARIARIFARTTRYDDVFSSCNRNFLLSGHDGKLWCGKCPKCHFVFLIFAPEMSRDRLVSIFGQNVLDESDNLDAFRELIGLSGHKPWECVGEILEAAASLWRIADHPDWRDTAIVSALRPELEGFYGAAKLDAAYRDLMTDSADHLIPAPIERVVTPNAY